MLKTGSIFLSLWSGINFLISSLILTIVVFHIGNSPLLGMVFEKSEIARLDAKSHCGSQLFDNPVQLLRDCPLSTGLVHYPVKSNQGQKWAFWALLITIGFVEILAFVASAPIGNARWQVNIILSALYVVGIGLSGYSLFKGDKK